MTRRQSVQNEKSNAVNPLPQTILRGVALVATVAGVFAARADALTVAQGSSYSPSAQETYASAEIHGTVNITGPDKTNWRGVAISPGNAACSLGTGAGDRAQVTIGDYGRLSGGIFTLGGANGTGGFVVGGKRPGDATGTPWDGSDAHLAVAGLKVADDATSASGVIDVLRLDAGAAAGLIQAASQQRLINASTTCDMRLLFNGGYFGVFNAFSTAYFFTTLKNSINPNDIPEGKGGRTIIMEGVDGNPVDLRAVNGTVQWASYGYVKFRGTGDVKLFASGAPSFVYGWYWNLDGGCWEQNGDLRLQGSFNFVCKTSDALPKAATNGIVRVEGDKYCKLDLSGYSQKLNGLVVSGGACLTNDSQSAATLTFGTGTPDACLEAPRVGGGAITARFQGAGTFSVSNTPKLTAFDIRSGTMRVTGDCTVASLSLANGVKLIVDGGTLTVTETFSDLGCAITAVNGGKLCVVKTCDTDAAISLEASGVGTAEVEKRGAGRLTLYSDSVIGTRVHIKEGTLGFARYGTTCAWLRFTFKKMWNGANFCLSEMRLLDKAGNRVDGGGATARISEGVGAGTEGSAVKNAAADCAPQDMAPQTIWASDSAWNLAEPDGGYRERTPSALFDGQTWTKVQYKTKVDPATSSSWKTFIVRLPATTAETYCYNFRNGYSGSGHPCDWLVEASADGITWKTVDERTGEQPPSANCQFYNGGQHFRLFGGETGAAGLAAGANVCVERGAVLDASGVMGGQTLDSLTVNCAPSTGVATLKGVRLAAQGTVNLLNYTRTNEFTIPWVFVDSETGGSLEGWQVSVNGVVDQKRRLAWRDGRLTVCGPGMLLILK